MKFKHRHVSKVIPISLGFAFAFISHICMRSKSKRELGWSASNKEMICLKCLLDTYAADAML